MSTPLIPEVHSRRINQLLAHYAQSHAHPSNQRIHFVAVPVIMLSLVGMLYALAPWLAYAFLAASMVYYVRLSMVFLIAMVAVSSLMLIVINALHNAGVLWPSCVLLFVVAWVFQFWGHHIEGRKPSFLEDVQYLWVGPLFVLSHVFTKFGMRW